MAELRKTLKELVAARFIGDNVYLIDDELLDYIATHYGKRVILAFSAGKDSLVAWLKLRDAGFDVIPYCMYLIPNLEFVERNVRYYEAYFNTPIMRFPHPHFYLNLAQRFNYQSPERIRILRSLGDTRYSAPDIDAYLCNQHNAGCVVYGLRWADNSIVRQSIRQHGAVFDKKRIAVYLIWNYSNDMIAEAIMQDGVKISDEYRIWWATVCGFQYRFLAGIRDNFPEDYQKVLRWFPLADIELYRWETVNEYAQNNTEKTNAEKGVQNQSEITVNGRP